MDSGSSTKSRPRHLVGLAVIAVMWWIAFHGHDRIPVLTNVNLGFHEFGHFVTYAFGDLFTAMMGSIAQVAVPAALAGYFFVFRSDWLAAALCLAWGATSALEVAVYVADAPYEELKLIGGQHDWAFILGPDGYNALGRAGSIADTIRDGALLALAAAFALCLAGLGRRSARERPELDPEDIVWSPVYESPLRAAEPIASASVVTPASRPWAASATSGSAPRSASSPKYTPPS